MKDHFLWFQIKGLLMWYLSFVIYNEHQFQECEELQTILMCDILELL